MPILNKNDKEQVRKYTEFVQNYKYTSATQDINWADVKSEWGDAQVYLEKDSEIVAAMSLLIRKVGPYTMLYAPKGPVADIEDIETVELLLKEVEAFAKKNKAFVLRFDPEVVYTEELRKLYEKHGFIVRGRGYDKDELIQPLYNMVLNVENKTEEELLAQFSNKTRYNISLSSRKGVEVVYGDSDEYLQIFYDIHEIMAERNKIAIRNLDYFRRMMKAFGANIRVYLAKHEDSYLAGAVTLHYGDKVWYVYGASSNEKRNLMPNYLMQWEMIKWALEVKAKTYDFGGVFVLNKENGLYKFKEGFCRVEGVTEYIGEIDKVYNPLVYKLFTAVLPGLRKAVKKIRKK